MSNKMCVQGVLRASQLGLVCRSIEELLSAAHCVPHMLRGVLLSIFFAIRYSGKSSLVLFALLSAFACIGHAAVTAPTAWISGSSGDFSAPTQSYCDIVSVNSGDAVGFYTVKYWVQSGNNSVNFFTKGLFIL